MTKAARWIALGALFLIPFLPLYVEGSLFFPFITGKGFAFRILVEVALAAWLILALADKRYRPQFSWPLAIYGLLVVWMFIADLFALNPHKAFWSNYERMDGWVTLIHVFLFFVVAGSVLTVTNLWKKWWFTVLGASVLVAGYGLMQVIGAASINQGSLRLDANIGNAAYYAAYLLFIIAIALWQAIESKGWLRYVLFVLAGLQVLLLFGTATRGAILGFVGAVGLGAILWLLASTKEKRRASIALLAGLVLIVGGFFLLKDASVVRDNPILSRIASISLADGSTRFTLWEMAGKATLERPITGWGHEGYGYVFMKYYDPSLYAQEPWFDRAHGVFIDWLIYGGVPAFLLFIALLGSAVVSLYRAQISRPARILLILAVVAYAFQALFVFDNLLSYILLAAILAVAHAGTSRPIARLEQLPEFTETRLRVAAPVILAILLVVIWFVNIPGILGGQSLIKAVSARQMPETAFMQYQNALSSGSFATQEIREQLIGYASMVAANPSVPRTIAEGGISLALTEMQKEMARVPEDIRLRIMYAQALETIGDLEGTLRELTAAHELSPKKQAVLLQMGLESWKLNDRVAAKAAFTEAYELDPSFTEAAAYAATGEIINGNIAGGQEILRTAFGTTTVDHDILRFAYVEKKLFDELVKSARLHVVVANASADSRYYLARALATAGRMNEARAEVEATIAAHPETAAAGAQLLRQLGGGK